MQLRPALAVGDHETGLLEDGEVLHHAEARHRRQLGAERAERAAVADEQRIEQPPPGHRVPRLSAPPRC